MIQQSNNFKARSHFNTPGSSIPVDLPRTLVRVQSKLELDEFEFEFSMRGDYIQLKNKVEDVS
jgi:hypothetical protein